MSYLKTLMIIGGRLEGLSEESFSALATAHFFQSHARSPIANITWF
jgi:hypothetical protein